MEPENVSSVTPAPGDRSRALAVYGWILIVVGVLCVLAALLFVALLALAHGVPGGPPLAASAVLFNVAFYLCLAAVFVSLGIGSIRARRWAQSLALLLSWVWLAVGVLALALTAFFVPNLLSQQEAGTTRSGVMPCVIVLTLAFVALFFVLLPLSLLLFYRRKDVRQTVEARNPKPDWTDRVPPSILGIVLALALGAVASVFAILPARAVPLFGTVLTGWTAAGVLLAFGAISALLAVAVYQRTRAGWWGLVALQVLGLANILTFRGLDMESLMREMGYPEEQSRLAGQSNIVGSPLFLGLMGAAWVALLLFLLSVRKHFRPGSTMPRSP